MKQLDLGKERIGKLLMAFSVPCIISLVVNALYNIVDQIFIGWGVGYLGNGATNVIFPITTICTAFAVMFGDGTSSYLSLKLGEKKQKEAQQGVVNGILASVIISIILGICIFIFLPNLITIFGGTDNLISYAMEYGYVIVFGLPFMMVASTLNSIIRADGSPKYSMISMLVGAILNIILDPIAIFVFDMGIKGAAIATVVSQIVNFIINICYLKKFKTIKLTKEDLKPSFKVMKSVATLGISSFITQMAIVVIITAENTLYNMYGADSKFGTEIPITVHGIVMKINMILTSIILGISAGSQPIIGYNYGSNRYDRVKQTLKMVLIASGVVSIISFVLFQTIPEKLISIFGSGDETYNEFACLAFRTYLMLTLVNGIQIASGIFFQAIGKSTKSAFITLSRQILFYIPAAVILSKFYGVMGVLYAGPVADGLAFVIAVILLIVEFKNLNKGENKNEPYKIKQEENKSNKKVIITINREYGSGGRYVGNLLAQKLGVKLYDKDLIMMVSNESGLSASYIEKNEQNITGKLLANFNSQYYNNLTNDDNLFLAESNAIKEIAEQGSCVIIGRCADYILRDNENVVKVFLHSDDINKVERAVKYYGIDEKNAYKEISKINKAREKHYNYYTGQDWKDLDYYDISINVDHLGIEKTVDMIEAVAKSKEEDIK
jgi:putative MATE family efflux protein